MTGRRYTFASTWRVAASKRECWEFLTAPSQRWTDWWPHLSSIEVDRVAGLVGSSAACTWRSPAIYTLRFRLILVDAVEFTRIELTSEGDLVGSAVIDFRPVPSARSESTHLLVAWEATTTRRWMNVLGPVLAPVFRWGHDVVMRAGERGLNAVLTHEIPRTDGVDPGDSRGEPTAGRW